MKKKKRRRSRTHGYGSKKKHRGKGSKGGTGNAGSSKHKYIKMLKEKPGHFGKKGFKSLKPKNKILNIKDIDMMDDKEINLNEKGYDKLLGAGYINKKVTVIIDKASKKAIEKIENAGGKVITENKK